MDRDKNGNPLVYVIYDKSRSGTTTGWWRVATFIEEKNANKFMAEHFNKNYFVSCQSACEKDYTLAMD